MILKLNTGIATAKSTFLPGQVVDWRDDADVERMLKAGLAVRAKPEEIKAAGDAIPVYRPSPARPEDRWPPGQLRELKRSFREED